MTESQLPSRVSVARDVIYSDFGPEIVILQLTRGLYYSLNDTGARIWRLVEQQAAPARICDALAREYRVEADVCTTDLSAFLNDLASGGLVDMTT